MRALVGDLDRASHLPDLALALDAPFLTPIQQLLDQGVADGSLRRFDDPTTVAASIFGAVTVTGLSVTAGRRPRASLDASSLSESIHRLSALGIAADPAT